MERCKKCGDTKNLKRGWTNSWYCSYQCELSHVSALHGSMPGAGPVPSHSWVPSHVGREIYDRWGE